MSADALVRFRTFSVALLAVVVTMVGPVARADDDELEVLWGPETFVRGKGAPVAEVREFSIEGFEAPFILHLRNGTEDGDNRVSSAWVYLNGVLVISPSTFSQQFEETEVPVDLTTPSMILVELASVPGAEVTIWIEGKRSAFQFEVGPDGGYFEFPFGLSLDFPPGAVDDYTELEVSEFDCAVVDALFAARTFIENPPRCLAAFRGLPDGLVFNTPITAWMPTPDLNPGEYIVQFYIDEEAGIARFEDSDLIHHRATGILEFRVQHFSGNGGGASEIGDGQYLDASELDACCLENPSPVGCCCNIPGDVTTKSTTTDQSSQDGDKACDLIQGEMEVCFLTSRPNGEACGCFIEGTQQASSGCEGYVRLKIKPRDQKILRCKVIEFSSVIEKDVGGSQPEPIWKEWIQNPSCLWADEYDKHYVERVQARLGPLASRFRGLEPPKETITATTLSTVGSQRLEDSTSLEVGDYPQMKVESVGHSGGTANHPEIKPNETIRIDASVEHLCTGTPACWEVSKQCGDETCSVLTWTPREFTDVIEIVEEKTGQVKGICPGFEIVEGRFTYCNQEFENSIWIDVDNFEPMILKAVSPHDGTVDAPKIEIGQTVQLEVTIPGVCGEGESTSCRDLVKNCKPGGTCLLTWAAKRGEYNIELDEQKGEATGKLPGTESVEATLEYCGTSMTKTINIEVKPPLGMHVRAKFGCCGWDASYCYVGAMQGNPVIPITVEAWLETSSGEVRDVPGGIYVSVSPMLTWADVQPGEDTCNPYSTSIGDRCSGHTDSEGILRLQLYAPTFRSSPFFSVRAAATFPGVGSSETRIFGVTDDICYEHPYAIVSNQGSGGWVNNLRETTRCSPSGNLSLTAEPGLFSAHAECAAAACCGPGCSMPGIWLSQTGAWFDTVLVIPEDLRVLNNMSGGMRLVISVTSDCSGSAEAVGDHSEASASISAGYFPAGNLDCRTSQPVDQSGYIERWGTISKPFYAFEQAGANAHCFVDPCLFDASGCESASASISGSLAWDEIVEAWVYDYFSYQYVPINFYLFSCSGRFTRGDVQAACQQ